MENLSRDKQIEELTKDLYGYSIDTEEDAAYVAKILIDKGYRKASDIALEVFEWLEEKGFLNIEVWAIQDVKDELKKKYTESEGSE